uniref:BACK domain-containing protein n=1 Tax=Timema cristinae TaxID=61476 RepID=A0A7R9H733_TIMCR|nr:unnamed protein product [Timema cristinae]
MGGPDQINDTINQNDSEPNQNNNYLTQRRFNKSNQTKYTKSAINFEFLGDENLKEEHLKKLAKVELTLIELGFGSTKSFDWNRATVHVKRKLVELIYDRVVNYSLTDIQVVIGEIIFNCHSMVLQSYSLFFERKTGKVVNIPVEKVRPEIFSLIYDWMITTDKHGYRMINRNIIVDTLISAKYLEVDVLIEQCMRLFDSEKLFSEYTAYNVFLEAKRKEECCLVDIMLPRIKGFFLTLVATQDFLELPLDELCMLLKSNSIEIHGEIEVFFAAIHWLKYKWPERKIHAFEVMQCVRFGLIPSMYIVVIRQGYNDPDIKDIVSIPEMETPLCDGLHYSILNDSYGIIPHHEVSEFNKWVSTLGCPPPPPRNIIGGGTCSYVYSQTISQLQEYAKCLQHRKTTEPWDDNNFFFDESSNKDSKNYLRSLYVKSDFEPKTIPVYNRPPNLPLAPKSPFTAPRSLEHKRHPGSETGTVGENIPVTCANNKDLSGAGTPGKRDNTTDSHSPNTNNVECDVCVTYINNSVDLKDKKANTLSSMVDPNLDLSKIVPDTGTSKDDFTGSRNLPSGDVLDKPLPVCIKSKGNPSRISNKSEQEVQIDEYRSPRMSRPLVVNKYTTKGFNNVVLSQSWCSSREESSNTLQGGDRKTDSSTRETMESQNTTEAMLVPAENSTSVSVQDDDKDLCIKLDKQESWHSVSSSPASFPFQELPCEECRSTLCEIEDPRSHYFYDTDGSSESGGGDDDSERHDESSREGSYDTEEETDFEEYKKDGGRASHKCSTDCYSSDELPGCGS